MATDKNRFKLRRRGLPIAELGLPAALVEFLSGHGVRTAEQLYSGMISAFEAHDALFDKFGIKYPKVQQLLRQKLSPEVMFNIEHEPREENGMGLVDDRQVM